MVAPVGSGSAEAARRAAAQAAAEAARRRAEEARRRAEEARRRAEAARKAAEAARKAADAAKKAADAAKKAAELAKKKAEASKTAAQNPGQAPEALLRSRTTAKNDALALREVEQKASTAAKKAEAARAKLQEAQEQVAIAAKTAAKAMTQANKVAVEDKVKPPFSAKELQDVAPTRNELATAFEGSARKAELEKVLGAAPTEADTATTEKERAAEKQYEALAAKEENRAALEQMGIKSGKELLAFGEDLSSKAKNGEAGPDVSKVEDKEAVARIIQGAAEVVADPEAQKLLKSEVFATAVAEGSTPKEAKETVDAAAKVGMSDRETIKLMRLSGGRDALRTLVDPNASWGKKISAMASIAQQASTIFKPEDLRNKLGDIGNRIFGQVGNAKAMLDGFLALSDPKASFPAKMKAVVGMLNAAKGAFGSEIFKDLGPHLRKLDGIGRAAGNLCTLLDPNAKIEDRVVAALQLGAEVPGIGRDLKQLKTLLTEWGVPNPEGIIQDAEKLTKEVLENLPDDVANRLQPGQLAALIQASDKVDPAKLGKAIANINDPAALEQVLKQIDAAPTAEAAEKFLATTQSLDPKIVNEALKDPDLAEKLAKLSNSVPADGAVNQLDGLLKQLKSVDDLKAVTAKLSSMEPADAKKLSKALKGIDPAELGKMLKTEGALDNLAKVVGNLDDAGIDQLSRTIKNMDAAALDALGRITSKVPADLLSKTLGLIAPVLEKVDSRLVGEGFKLLDKMLSKMGVEITGEVAGKILKNITKIIPAIGAIPGLIDAGLLAKESADLHGKNKDLGYLALVGSKLNAVDSIGGLILDFTGVGAAVDLGVGALFGIAELALDLGLSAEKKKMETQGDAYEAPGWVKTVNIMAAVATAPAGVADYVAYHGPEKAFENAKWALEQGGELAKKAWDLIEKAGGALAKYAGEAVEILKNAGEEGLELLQNIASGTSQAAKEAADAAREAIADMARLPGELGKKAAEAIGNAVEAGADWAKDLAVDLLKEGAEAMQDVARAWAENLTDGAKEVVDRLENLGEAGVEALTQLSKAGGALAEYTVGKLQKLAEDGLEVAKDALEGLQDLGGAVGDLAKNALGKLGEFISWVNPLD